MVKERLDKGLDSWLMNTQYGFRKKKSIAQAIYLARRLQDIAEKTNARSTLILLDWEKAFDKVSQEKMMETLHRLKVPSRIINLITSFYKDPQFKVSMGEDESSWRRQATGIRQGCPLSPYLFCLVMGALFADVQRELNTPRQKQPWMEYFSLKFCTQTILWFLAQTPNVSTNFYMPLKNILGILVSVWIMINASTWRPIRSKPQFAMHQMALVRENWYQGKNRPCI